MKILFFGTPEFSVPTLKALVEKPGVSVGAVFTQPDKPSGRGSKVIPSPVKIIAEQNSIPVFQPASLRKEFTSLKEPLNKLGPFDIGVVIAFGQILPKDVLQFPSHGCVNIHASLLPRWRGAAPIQRAIQAGDSETGISLMRMDEGLDTGAVYLEHRVPIHPTETGGSLHDRLATEGAHCLVEHLSAIVEGVLKPTPQETVEVTYATKITPRECQISWGHLSKDICLSVRAFSPSPGCYTMWRGKRLKILLASESKRTYSNSTSPGAIICAHGERFEIACGGGTSLLITEVQLEGKKRMPVHEFLRGTPIPEGEVLGA